MTPKEYVEPAATPPQRKIRTTFVYPPIPWRGADWQACFDGEEEAGPYGHGATEQEAIDELLAQEDA